MGPLAVPGSYTVSLARRVRDEVTPIGQPQTFETVPLGLGTLATEDFAELVAFQKQTARLQRAVLGAARALAEADSRLDHLAAAYLATPAADPALRVAIDRLDDRLEVLGVDLLGDEVVRNRNEPTPSSIVEMVQNVVYGHWTTTAAPTRTHRDSYARAAAAFAGFLAGFRALAEEELPALEAAMEAAGAPWTPGRVPQWEPE
jgi:hypothetical protein